MRLMNSLCERGVRTAEVISVARKQDSIDIPFKRRLHHEIQATQKVLKLSVHPRFWISFPVDFRPKVKVRKMQQPHLCHLPISFASNPSLERTYRHYSALGALNLNPSRGSFQTTGIVLNFKAQKHEPA
jgi:hypothetical protein